MIEEQVDTGAPTPGSTAEAIAADIIGTFSPDPDKALKETKEMGEQMRRTKQAQANTQRANTLKQSMGSAQQSFNQGVKMAMVQQYSSEFGQEVSADEMDGPEL